MNKEAMPEALESFLKSKEWLDLTSVKVGVGFSVQRLNTRELAECVWKAAVEASGAQYIPALVEILRRINGYASHDDGAGCAFTSPGCLCGYSDARRDMEKLLASLPPELKGE